MTQILILAEGTYHHYGRSLDGGPIEKRETKVFIVDWQLHEATVILREPAWFQNEVLASRAGAIKLVKLWNTGDSFYLIVDIPENRST